MPFMVLMATKPVFTAATSTALQESLAFIEKRLRLVAETLTVAGDTILGGFPNAEFAQQAAMKLLSVAGQGVGREWQIGIAAGGDNAALQASQLANAASVGEAVIALEAYSLLTAKSRARYLPAETIAGRQACRTLPRGDSPRLSGHPDGGAPVNGTETLALHLREACGTCLQPSGAAVCRRPSRGPSRTRRVG